jgi:hypothetical protein
LQEILDSIKQAKQTIRAYRYALVSNQVLTRYALVDVLLKAAGWDVHDPAQVFPEWDMGHTGQKAEYALLDNAGRPVAAIRVTPLSGFAVPDLAKFAALAQESSIRFAILTDGNLWLVADAASGRAPQDLEIMRVNLETDPENFLLLNFASLAPSNLRELELAYFLGQPARSPESAPSQAHSHNRKSGTGPLPAPAAHRGGTGALEAPAPETNPAAAAPSQTQLSNAEWLPISDIVNAITAPMLLRYPDSSVENTQGSFQRVLAHLAEYIIRHNKYFQAPVEDYEGKKRFLINLIPAHKDGTPFGAKVMLFNGWYMETDYSPADCKKNAIWLIQKAGENPHHYFFS